MPSPRTSLLQTPASAVDLLAASLPTEPTSSQADKNAFVLSATSSLTSLRTSSHQLSEELKAEKQRVSEAKAKVDQARLELENRRLEEMELQEEIRRESSE